MDTIAVLPTEISKLVVSLNKQDQHIADSRAHL